MILVDTSTWVDHLRSNSAELARALTEGVVLGHPCVLGELACGNLHGRQNTLELLRDLPQAVRATDEEALECIERNKLHGRGIGWIDVQLLASALLSSARLWTLDGPLSREAKRCGVACE